GSIELLDDEDRTCAASIDGYRAEGVQGLDGHALVYGDVFSIRPAHQLNQVARTGLIHGLLDRLARRVRTRAVVRPAHIIAKLRHEPGRRLYPPTVRSAADPRQ